MRVLIIMILSFSSLIQCATGQEQVLASLPEKLSESSGLVAVGTSFLSINDSGGEPIIYVFNVKGDITHTCQIKNAKNIDWEAITIDKHGFVYIGDFGNNDNQRADFTIYKLKLTHVLSKSYAEAVVITYLYPDQKDFPPEKATWYYDTEAFIVRQDSIFIFTKNRTQPFDGLVKVYGLANQPGKQSPKEYPPISLPATSWLENSVTDACVFQNKTLLLTYRYVYVVENSSSPKIIDIIEFNGTSQKEGVYYHNGAIYLTDEKTILGGPKLYKINFAL